MLLPAALSVRLAAALSLGLVLGPTAPVAALEHFGCQAPARGARFAPRFGFDPGLARRCIESAKPGMENFYADRSECGADGAHWVVANHSGPNCNIGPDGQTFPINDGFSPLSLQWLPEVGPEGQQRWALRMVTDLQSREHPCWRAKNWTWFSLQNRSLGAGVPLPRPDQLEQVVHLSYREANATSLAKSRMGVSAQLFWDGVGHLVEINLYQSPFWGDAHPAADIVLSRPLLRNRTHGGREVVLNGRFMYPPIALASDQAGEVRVSWHAVIANLIERGLLPAPIAKASRAEDPWFETAVTNVAVYTEIAKRNASPRDAAIADVTIRDFRVEARPSERGAWVASVTTCDERSDRLVIAGSGLDEGSRLQLFNRYHVPLGEPLVPIDRVGNTGLLFDLDPQLLARKPAVLRIVDPESGRVSNFSPAPPLD